MELYQIENLLGSKRKHYISTCKYDIKYILLHKNEQFGKVGMEICR